MLTLRRAREEDCRLLWEWANDTTVRALSFSTDPIPWDEHVNWFEAKLEDPLTIILIGVDHEGQPVGQARYNIQNEEAVISISIAQEYRGKGFGSELIHIASELVFVMSDVCIIRAYIKPENKASIKAFDKAGFREFENAKIHGQVAFQFALEREA